MTTSSPFTSYYNSKAPKSHKIQAILTSHIIRYFTTPLSQKPISQLLLLFNFSSVRKLMRLEKKKHQTLHFTALTFTKHKLLQALQTYPKPIEVPSVIYNNTAYIGYPSKNVLTILPPC